MHFEGLIVKDYSFALNMIGTYIPKKIYKVNGNSLRKEYAPIMILIMKLYLVNKQEMEIKKRDYLTWNMELQLSNIYCIFKTEYINTKTVTNPQSTSYW